MKQLYFLFAICIFLQTGLASAQYRTGKYWKLSAESLIAGKEQRDFFPAQYKTFTLDLSDFQSAVGNPPQQFSEASKRSSVIIDLPLPDEKIISFRIVETEILHPALAAKFPYIKTYAGQSIDDPRTEVRFDITQFGFHGVIMSPGGWVFIEPYIQGNTRDYICFYKRDAVNPNTFYCETQLSREISTTANQLSGSSLFRSSGTQLRTYRLALACTGEYAAYHGGTVSGALAGMTTTMNVVNGIFNREVAVHMTIIPNDTLIIYTDAATDPYTNSSPSTMLGQNITTCDNVIGSANYDIGHVFGTAGGGVAYLNAPCNSFKAGSATGLNPPSGNVFNIDYVSHEMGHQYGANHTFNSIAGSCGSNRAGSAAYEPGSGSTIMSYSGLCSPDNLQTNSDPYFHAKSFEEMHLNTTQYSGSTCPVVTSTGNNAPVINAGPDWYIPISTPFILNGTATDPDGDTLSYGWEEYDLGPGGSPNNPSGDAPIFRHFTPTASSSRIFPKLSDIINNTQTLGEILPSYPRVLDFRFTVRDNKLNGAGRTHNDTTVKVNVVNNGGPFKVTSPNTAVTWYVGQSMTVMWDVSGTDLSPISCSSVNILLSTNGGNSFSVTLASGTANDGSEIIVVPNNITTQARVKVEAAGNIFFDMSNSNFTIAASAGSLTQISTWPLNSNNLCAGFPVIVQFNTNGPANAGNVFTAQLSNSSGSFASPVDIGTLNATTGPATISATIPPATPVGTGYRIRVISSSPSVTGSTNGTNISILNQPAAAGTINSPDSVCQSQTGVIFSVASIANATNYSWSFPVGATITSNPDNDTVTVSFSSSAVSGNVTVFGYNAGCSGTSSVKSVFVKPLPGAAGSISGAPNVCQQQSGVVYSVLPIANAAGYNWVLPAGASITGGANTNSITVSFSASASSGNITVTGANACGNGTTSAPYAITVNAAPTQPVITNGGVTTICSTDSTTLFRTNVAGVNYQWRKNAVNIPGATGTSYVAHDAGTYDVAASWQPTPAQMFSNNTSYAIPDSGCGIGTPGGGGAQSPIAVSGYVSTINTAQIQVTINISHTKVGDLVILMEAPNGQLLGFSDRTGNSGNTGDHFVNTVFSDLGATIIPTCCAPYTGIYKPWNTLIYNCQQQVFIFYFAALAGGSMNPNGTWKLKVYDMATGDIGSITGWSITFPPAAVNTCTSTSNAITISVTQASTWYADGDGDGYGNAAVTTLACSQPSGYVNDSTDCNDTLNTVHPNATEVCNNGMDDDCDTDIDEGCCINNNIVITKTKINVSCNGGSDGVINITVTGGTPPYSYTWSNGATTEDLVNIPKGTYVVTVTDAVGCTKTNSTTISQPAKINITKIKTDVTCWGGSDGAINITVTGGTPPYTFNWSNGATTEDLVNIPKGTYLLTVTDSKGCTKTNSTTVSQPPRVNFTISTTSPSVPGGNDGTATANVTVGVAPYSFLWNTAPSQTTQTATGLTAGTYNIVVTDADGCTRSKNATVTDPPVRLADDAGESNALEIYPNPAHGSLVISHASLNEKRTELKIFNALGKIVFQSEITNPKSEIELSHFAKGVYSVWVKSGERVFVERLIIE